MADHGSERGKSSNRMNYAFLDCGSGRRLERFAGRVVSRPAPAADNRPGLSDAEWRAADLIFSRELGWRGDAPADWRVAFGPAVLNLRPASRGQLGVFPEHAAVCDRIDAILDADTPPEHGWSVLNLFAHTGLATLRLAARHDVRDVAHVDAAPASVRLARENAADSGLSGKRVRWLADDAMQFMKREARRGNRYDIIIADPPSYGRNRKSGGEWKIERDLPGLLETASALLSDRPALLCLTCHSVGWTEADLAGLLRQAVPDFVFARAEPLALVPESGATPLPAGIAGIASVRW